MTEIKNAWIVVDGHQVEHGPWVIETDMTQERGEFVRGQREGEWVFYRYKKQIGLTTYVKGVKHGPYFGPAPIRLQESGTYLHGKKHGAWQFFFTEGDGTRAHLQAKGHYEHGQKVGLWTCYHFHTRALKREQTYENGTLVGPRKSYDFEGKLLGVNDAKLMLQGMLGKLPEGKDKSEVPTGDIFFLLQDLGPAAAHLIDLVVELLSFCRESRHRNLWLEHAIEAYLALEVDDPRFEPWLRDVVVEYLDDSAHIFPRLGVWILERFRTCNIDHYKLLLVMMQSCQLAESKYYTRAAVHHSIQSEFLSQEQFRELTNLLDSDDEMLRANAAYLVGFRTKEVDYLTPKLNELLNDSSQLVVGCAKGSLYQLGALKEIESIPNFVAPRDICSLSLFEGRHGIIAKRQDSVFCGYSQSLHLPEVEDWSVNKERFGVLELSVSDNAYQKIYWLPCSFPDRENGFLNQCWQSVMVFGTHLYFYLRYSKGGGFPSDHYNNYLYSFETIEKRWYRYRLNDGEFVQTLIDDSSIEPEDPKMSLGHGEVRLKVDKAAGKIKVIEDSTAYHFDEYDLWLEEKGVIHGQNSELSFDPMESYCVSRFSHLYCVAGKVRYTKELPAYHPDAHVASFEKVLEYLKQAETRLTSLEQGKFILDGSVTKIETSEKTEFWFNQPMLVSHEDKERYPYQQSCSSLIRFKA